jgi:hypothetical protein
MFGKKKSAPRICPQGHPMEDTWERCAYCEAEKAPLPRAGENGSATVTPTEAVEIVARKETDARRLVGWLVVVAGDQADQDFRVHAGRNVIGKGSKADIVIRDAYLSERHALLESTEDGFVLSDLKSKRGTFLNGKAVEAERSVRDGDRIRVGNTELRFRTFAG